MTEKTDNRSYNVPEAGQTDWHEPVNENWESIDADVQTVMEMAEAALERATHSDDETEPVESRPAGISWDQTNVDTQWLFDADAEDNLTVETVTNLDASGSGSLADALDSARSNDNTIIVFEVGGVIDNEGSTYLRTRADNVYVAGQTAPYPGITLIRGGVRAHGNNNIWQHMTFLPGDDVNDHDKSRAFTIDDDGGQNFMVDHCAMGWAADVNVSLRESTDSAVINCINTEPMNNSSHPDAAPSDSSHGYSLHLRNEARVSYIGNLQTHGWKRNNKQNDDTQVVFANNYIYNWGARVYHDSEETSKTDWIKTVIEAGDDTSEAHRYGIFKDQPGVVYWSDNKLIPEDTVLSDGNIEYVDSPMDLPSGLSEDDLVSPDELEAYLAKVVGPRPADRDPFSRRIVSDFVNKTGKIIDDHLDVGGYPAYGSKTRSLTVPKTDILEWVQRYTADVEGTA